MQRSLDYTHVWKDTLALLNSHKEGILAVAGVFLFLPTWANEFLSGQPDVEDVVDLSGYLVVMEGYWAANWQNFLVTMLLGFFGTISIYVLIARRGVDRIGDALSRAFALILVFFGSQFLAGIATFAGMAALFLPGLYLVGRLAPLPAVIAAENGVGVLGAIARSWDLTRGNGWATFFLLLIVGVTAWVIALVAQLLVGLAIKLVSGGIPLLETGIGALGQTAVSVVMIMLATAIYRHLSVQDAA